MAAHRKSHNEGPFEVALGGVCLIVGALGLWWMLADGYRPNYRVQTQGGPLILFFFGAYFLYTGVKDWRAFNRRKREKDREP